MKILLTGHTGFVGLHVERSLRDAGFTTYNVSRTGGHNLTDKAALLKTPDCDLIVHLAGEVGVEQSWVDPDHFYRTNYLATLAVAEYARKRKTPVILLSSYMYGNPGYLPIDETHPVSCNNPYAYSKKMSEDILISYNQLFGVSVKILRPMNLYGKGMPESNIVGLILRQACAGSVIRLRDLSPKRDYMHVTDLASAILSIIEKGVIGGLDIYNLGIGKSYSVADIIVETGLLTGKQFEVIETAEKRANEISDCYANIDKFSEEFSWKPKVTLREGLRTTLMEMCH